ncbi:hypothetical protein CRX69_11895 [Pseudomonas rhizophila]|uniref:Uncharacterized protein n=1 Tax=Pseudomonas rhizophila TaxID=2045200 RepID=A0ABM6UEI7_9PSED|nr:hypothetical protein CRX69_11895 [Pseudomonas rhizophila]
MARREGAGACGCGVGGGAGSEQGLKFFVACSGAIASRLAPTGDLWCSSILWERACSRWGHQHHLINQATATAPPPAHGSATHPAQP